MKKCWNETYSMEAELWRSVIWNSASQSGGPRTGAGPQALSCRSAKWVKKLVKLSRNEEMAIIFLKVITENTY